MKILLLRCGIAAALFGLGSAGLARAEAAAAAAKQAPVELPEMKVFGDRVLPQPEAWRYTVFGNMEVLSNASDGTSRLMLRDFLMFQQALGIIWPVPARPMASSTLILCGRGGKYDQFIPAGTEVAESASASQFFHGREHRAIVVDLQAREITLSDQGELKRFEIDANRQLYREYVRFLFAQAESRPPAWVEEGLAQIIMAMEVTEKWVRFGFIDSTKFPSASFGSALGMDDETAEEEPETVVPDRPFNVALRSRRLMPMAKFLAVAHDDPAARNAVGNNLWAKQAYAMMHLCLYGQKGRYQKALGMYLQRLGKEPATEALFKECFGVDYKEWQMRLRGYLQATTFEYFTAVSKGGAQLGGEVPTLREATQGEIGRIKGNALLLAGKTEAAHAEFLQAYLRGERDPKLLAALGLSELRAGQAERGQKFLEAAAVAHTTDPLAHIELARLRLAELTAAHPDGLPTSALSRVLTPLFTARQQPPPLPETYALIAEAWTRSATPPKPEHLAVLDEGVKLFPRDSALVLTIARLNARFGDPARAAAMAQFGLRGATDPALRQQLEQLAAAAPAAPTPAKP